MAGLVGFSVRALSSLGRASLQQQRCAVRFLSSAAPHSNKEPEVSEQVEKPEGEKSDKGGWLQRLMPVRNIDVGHQSHSQLLSDKDTVYELQIHSVKPEFMEKYLTEYQQYVDMVNDKKTGAELSGSWTVEIGDQDEAIHLWKHPGGYPQLNAHKTIARSDQDFVNYRVERNKMLRSRKNQILLAFSFWGEIKTRGGPSNIYELRSYTLKPGTMIEWGNHWARGVKSRREEDEAVGGFFSHIGDLYNVHHLWAYENLQTRKRVREDAWRRPGWDDCVAYTVPLIRHMTARILIPTPFSPMK